MKSEMGKIFGGYTDIPWTNNRRWVSDGNANSFVFSLRDDFNFVKLRCLKKENEVYHYASWLCCIGYNPSGFSLYNDCNI